jgi:6,7-dimethyl-8-ribityllumazine synthase
MEHREDDVVLDASGLRVAIVVSDFNREITDGLLSGARIRLKLAKCDNIDVIRSPGAFELPLLAKKAAESGYDAVVALGAVIEGETDHYYHIASQATSGLMQATLQTGVPIGLGVLTVREAEHGAARSASGPGNKGAEAAAAAVRAALALRSMGPRRSSTDAGQH